MHPPGATCEALYRLHPQLRLAWAGRKRSHPSELNAGSFCLVQLYDLSDCGGEEDAFTFREFWNSTVVEDSEGYPKRVKAHRGPIFNRHGGTTRDWDPLFRFPIFVVELDSELQYPWGEHINPIDDVFTGKIIEAVRFWLRPIEDRVISSYTQKSQRVKDQADQIAGDFGERLWHDSNQTASATRRDIAYKHAKEDIVAQEKLKANDPLDQVFKVPPAPTKDLKRRRH